MNATPDRGPRWLVLFAGGAVEPVRESPRGNGTVTLSIRDRVAHYEDSDHEVAGGAMDLFARLLNHGARYLVDAKTAHAEVTALAARFGVEPAPVEAPSHEALRARALAAIEALRDDSLRLAATCALRDDGAGAGRHGADALVHKVALTALARKGGA